MSINSAITEFLKQLAIIAHAAAAANNEGEYF